MTNILSDITSEVANLGKVYTNSEKLAEMISKLTNDICHELDINVRLVRQNINYFDSIPGFMCAYPKEIHYSLDKIKEFLGEENFEAIGAAKDELKDSVSETFEQTSSYVKKKYNEWKNK